MSHFTVLVIGENPEKQLQPFHEYECTGIRDEYVVFHSEPIEELKKEYQSDNHNYDSFELFLKDWQGYEQNSKGEWGRWTNPNSKWDWYSLGGRWAGFFTLKKGEKGTQGHHRAKDFAHITGDVVEDIPDIKVDQCFKGQIDIERMRLEARAEAIKDYSVFLEALNGEPLPPKWNDFRSSYEDIESARVDYNNIQGVKNLKSYWEFQDYLMDQDAFIKSRVDNVITTFAIVKDSKWYERGQMGWFGISRNEKDDSTWMDEFNKMFNELPDDTLISLYDCHI